MDSVMKGSSLMLLELSVSVQGEHKQADDPTEDVNRIIDASGLHHEAAGNGTVLEGSWEQLMTVAKRCHDEVLKKNHQFTTLMKAVDDQDNDAAAPALDGATEFQAAFEDDGEWLML
jgi:uncharacterized protein YqgV (UPF0045/DUF77 family)